MPTIRQNAVKLQVVLATVIVGATIFVAFNTLQWTLRAWSPTPWLDQWQTVGEYIRFKSGGSWWAELIRPHNEHRLVVPRLFFFLDYEWFGGGNRLLLPMCVAIQAAHVALLLWIGRPTSPSRDAGDLAALIAVAATVVGLFFGLGQFENFFWGFQIAFVGVFALTTLAYALLTKAVVNAKSGSPWIMSFAAGAIALVSATFTMANGLLAGGVAVVLMLALRASWQMVVATALIVAASAAAFFAGYPTSGDSGGLLATLLQHPVLSLQYVATFIGGIAGAASVAPALAQFQAFGCAALGAIGILLALLSAARIVSGRERDPNRIVLVALMAFVGASAIVTAGGRLEAFGVGQALSSRYATPAALFWSAAILYWLSVARTLRRPERFTGSLMASLAVLTVILLIGQFAIRPTVMDWIAKVRWGEDAQIARAPDLEALSGISFNSGQTIEDAAFLRPRNLGAFSQPEALWLGKPLGSLAKIAPEGTCLGAVDAVSNGSELTGRRLRLSGWAWNHRDKREATRIVVTDAALRVTGLGSLGTRREDVPAAVRSVHSQRTGWRAFARGENGDTLRVFAVLPDGQVCAVGSKVISGLTPQVALARISKDRLGPLIPAAAAGQGIFLAGGYPEIIGPPPAPGYSSWAGSDANTGSITFGPFTPSSNLIAFGLVTGIDPENVVLQVVDAETGEILTQVRPGARLSWNMVGLSVTPGREVRLTAEDKGRAFGDWVGITTPYEVKP